MPPVLKALNPGRRPSACLPRLQAQACEWFFALRARTVEDYRPVTCDIKAAASAGAVSPVQTTC